MSWKSGTEMFMNQLNLFVNIQIPTRWVFTEKYMNKEKRTKAILVVRGVEEQNSEVLRNSQTCRKECLWLVLWIASTKGWDCNSTDRKSLFLQGKEIGWNVYLIPPIEAKS